MVVCFLRFASPFLENLKHFAEKNDLQKRPRNRSVDFDFVFPCELGASRPLPTVLPRRNAKQHKESESTTRLLRGERPSFPLRLQL